MRRITTTKVLLPSSIATKVLLPISVVGCPRISKCCSVDSLRDRCLQDRRWAWDRDPRMVLPWAGCPFPLVENRDCP